eukprot:TRINITY_DN62_c0_g2_i6.p1 TRINITY_DN62_c0_g2~~TRINITY_DN62_c0_g2_i6.p1  ORF type:complete len:201 (-),score=19.40 TRINITY_DN62_c0_g2_i6:85-687(-)
MIGLDASAMGAPLYRRLGFEAYCSVSVHTCDDVREALKQFTQQELKEAESCVVVATREDRARLAQADCIAFGAGRSKLISCGEDYFAWCINSTEGDAEPEGVVCRVGAVGTRIGSIYAHSECSMRLLLAAVCAKTPDHLTKKCDIWIPSTAAEFSVRTVVSHGFKTIGTCERMWLKTRPDAPTVHVLPPWYCSILGPDLG